MAGGSGFRTSEERDWSNEDWVRLRRHETDSMGCDGMFATAISKHLSGCIGVGVGVGSRVNFSDDDSKAVSANSTLTHHHRICPTHGCDAPSCFRLLEPSVIDDRLITRKPIC